MTNLDYSHLPSMDECKTPETWSQILSTQFKIEISPRVVREHARSKNAYFMLGRNMLLSPKHVEQLWGVKP